MREQVRDKKALVALLAKSPHGKLIVYRDVALAAAQNDPDFYHHVVAWNHVKGAIRDAKIALPVLALKALDGADLAPDVRDLLLDNALAHLADLRPREFARAVAFAWDIKAPTRLMKRLTIRYLRDLEAEPRGWVRTALLHRRALRFLYGHHRLRFPVRVPGGEAALFGAFRKQKGTDYKVFREPLPGMFAAVATLKLLAATEIGGLIDKYKLPFMVARDAVGGKAKEPDVALALMKRMSSTELVTNMKWLKRIGVDKVPALRSALEAALGTAGTAAALKKTKKGAVLKTTRAAEAMAHDEVLSGKLRVLQEKQIDHLDQIDGDWLFIADKSGSMEVAMEAAKVAAAAAVRLVKGKVYLVFVDEDPQFFDMTGKTLEQIKAETATITANGGTSLGCAVQYLAERKLAVDGIAIISDGCENAHLAHAIHQKSIRTSFAYAYREYATWLDAEPAVYWYRVQTSYPPAAVAKWPTWQLEQQSNAEIAEFRRSVRAKDIDVQEFDLTGGVDYYSVPNLVQTMKIRRYELFDQIRAVPLRRLDEVLEHTRHEAVLPKRPTPVLV